MGREKAAFKAFSVLVVLWAFSGCGREPIPAELLGAWFTSAPGYQGASMEITAETITFRDGKGYASVNRIIGIEKKGEDGRTLYNLHYEGNEGGGFVLSFYVKQVSLGKDEQMAIVYKNQKELTWTKDLGGGKG